MPRARIGAFILVFLYSSLCTFRLIKWLSFLAFYVYLFHDLVPALYFLSLSGIFLCITVYFPLGILQEACNTAIYLQNKSTHRALGHVTPEEAFSGKKHNVGHFRIFGCIAYSYVAKENRTKLEPTAEKGIFVGYSETSKAFRIYIPT